VQLRGEWNQDFSFLTDNVNFMLEIDQGIGEFSANGDQTRIEFPYNLYETNLDKFTWSVNEGTVELLQSKLLPENNVDIGIDSLKTNGPFYRSLVESQDNLSFVAPEATYDFASRHLFAHQVPFIEVADAYVFPDSGEVEICYQASMNLLKNAKIMANQENRQHNIYGANVAIQGAKS